MTYANMSTKQLQIEKQYRKEYIALLEYIQTRYNNVQDDIQKKAVERVIDKIVGLMEVEK